MGLVTPSQNIACGQMFAANSNLLFHSQVEALLASEDYGKDLASVNNLLKKHQLLEADISAHEVSRVAPKARVWGIIHAKVRNYA